MSFSSDNGYTPLTFEQIMDAARVGVNDQFGNSYTEESFVGTNWYKYFYAIVQKIQENEIKLSEVFQELQEYIELTNQMIQRPSVSMPGLIDSFDAAGFLISVRPPDEDYAGLVDICVDIPDSEAGVQSKGTIEIDTFGNLLVTAGDTITVGATAFVAQSGSASPGTGTFQAASSDADTAQSLCDQINAHAVASLVVRASVVDTIVTVKAQHRGTAGDSIVLTYTDAGSEVGAVVSGSGTLEDGENPSAGYAATKLTVCQKIRDFVAAGMVTQGTEEEEITLSNAQAFFFRYHLPRRIPVLLRMTAEKSENNLLTIPTDVIIRQAIFNKTTLNYKMGYNFEPERYFTLDDAPWASELVLEWSDDDGDNWHDEIFETEFDQVFTYGLEDIQVVIT